MISSKSSLRSHLLKRQKQKGSDNYEGWKKTPPDSMEATVLRNYLEWLLCIAMGRIHH